MITSLRKPVLSSDSFSNRVHHRAAGFFGVGLAHVGFHRGVHPLGHVFDADQHVQFQVNAFEFVVARFGVKTFGHQIAVGRAQFLQRIGADVMVGDHQSIGRNKRPAAAAVKPHRRLLHVVQPRVAGLEVVFFLEQLLGRIGKQPHPLVAVSLKRWHGNDAGKQDGFEEQ